MPKLLILNQVLNLNKGIRLFIKETRKKKVK